MSESGDYAGEIATLMQLGMAGDTEAQQTVMQLIEKAEAGDVRIARFIDDAASRIKEQRHYPEEGPKNAADMGQRLGELMGTADGSQPTEKEQKLLAIIAKMAGEQNGQGQDTELRAGKGSAQDGSLPEG